jgi:hypothetical protein
LITKSITFFMDFSFPIQLTLDGRIFWTVWAVGQSSNSQFNNEWI